MKTGSQCIQAVTTLLTFIAALGWAPVTRGGAVTGTLYFTRYSGSPRVNKVDFLYDGGTNFYLTNIVGIADLPGADGMVIAPDGSLIIGGQANAVYKVDPISGAVVSASAGGGQAYHMSLDPNRTRAWSDWGGSPLIEVPLDPFANGITHNLTGDDTSVLTLAWDPAGNVYYTSAGGGFGVIDLTKFVTTRKLTPPADHGMAYDPFTGTLIVSGGNHLSQISADPVNPKVISDLDLGTRGIFVGFDQGTVDGRGHVFFADNGGKLVFVDYSASKRIGDTNNFVAAPFLAPNLDDVAPIGLLGNTNTADLTLHLGASANPAPVHANLTLTLTVTNKGPDAATGLQLNTSVPENVTLVSATASQGSVAATNGSLVLTLSNLASQATVSLTLVVQPNSGPLVLRGNVIANETDPYFFDNFASLSVDAPFSCFEPPSGMVTWWPAEGSTNDVVGTNHATLLGAASFLPAQVGLGFNFNADGAGVTAPDSPAFDVNSNGFTAEFWMRGWPNQPQSLYTVLEKSHGFVDSEGWAFQGNSGNGTISFFIGAGGSGNGNFAGLASSSSVLDGHWHHLAGTWDGTNVWLYVDGVSQGSAPLSNPANNTRALNVGFAWGNGTAQRFFRGTVDEVTFYNRALAPAEIGQIFFANRAGKCGAPVIVPNPLPGGVVNLPYDATLALAHATPPYQFALTTDSGPLPTGFTLAAAGLLSGTTPNPGSYPIQVKGTDASNEVAQANLTVPIYTCDPPPLGLIGWWRAEGDATDAIGVHNGTAQNGVTFVPGKAGQAFDFDGSSGFIDLGQWSPGAQWTLEAWVNPSALPAGRHSIVGGLANCYDWAIAMQDGQFGVVIRPPGGCTQTISSGAYALVGTWYHVVGTCDGTTARIYVNGTLMNAGAVDHNYIGTTAGTRIGNEGCCGNYFPGLIDEVSIYDRPLGDAEIQALYTADAAGKCAGGQPPQIATQPQSEIVATGTNGVFTVAATGPGPLSYQWFLNQVPIPGATNATLTLSNLAGTEGGFYTVAVSNPAGTLISAPASLTVINLSLYAGITVDGIVGRNYRIDYVTNLSNTNWTTLTSFTLPSSPYLYIDTQSPTNTRRFYRAVLSP